MWEKAPLKVGDCLYLEPGTIKRIIKTKRKEQVAELDKNYDPVKFPEYYRKKGTIKGSNNDTPDPFDIVLVKEFKNDLGEMKMWVQIFYRPENTHKGYKFAESKYLNELYYSDCGGLSQGLHESGILLGRGDLRARRQGLQAQQ